MSMLQSKLKHDITHRKKRFNYFFLFVVCAGAILTFFPFYWMITGAFKTQPQILKIPPLWWPSPWILDNLKDVWTQYKFSTYMVNSLFVTGTITIISLYTSALIGYVVAKFNFPGKNVFFICILATNMIPPVVLIISQYQLAATFHLIDKYAGLILPGIFNIFGIFTMRQFMHEIPQELLDAARVDGCSELGIFHTIVLPNISSAIGAAAIFIFIGSWNNFLWPLLVINKTSMFTLPVGLAMFNGQHVTDFRHTLAGALISVLPVILFFALFQRWISKGFVTSGLKG